MNIISKFKDYYDGAVQYGYEPDITFVRHTQVIEVDYNRFKQDKLAVPIPAQIAPTTYENYDESATIYFCGRVYPVFLMSPDRSESYMARKWCTLDEAIKIAEKREAGLSIPYYYEHESYRRNHLDSETLRRFGTRLKTDLSFQLGPKFFIQFDSPYFIRLKQSLVINPKLETYSFFKYLDTFTCYQEIRMYLGNVLTKQDLMPMTTGGDRVLAQQKGFDDMSFRTLAPGTKKLNRAANRAKKRGLV